MKLETLVSIFIIALVMLLSLVSQEAVYFLGLFVIGWNLPAFSKAVANRFRNRNRVEA